LVAGVTAARTASRSDSATGVWFDPPLREDLVDEPERAAVGVVGDDHVVAGPQDGSQRAVGGGHARGEGATEVAALDGGQ